MTKCVCVCLSVIKYKLSLAVIFTSHRNCIQFLNDFVVMWTHQINQKQFKIHTHRHTDTHRIDICLRWLTIVWRMHRRLECHTHLHSIEEENKQKKMEQFSASVVRCSIHFIRAFRSISRTYKRIHIQCMHKWDQATHSVKYFIKCSTYSSVGNV